MRNALKRLWKDEDGASAVEYGLIAGLISIAIIAGAALAGPKLTAIFNSIANGLPTVT